MKSWIKRPRALTDRQVQMMYRIARAGALPVRTSGSDRGPRYAPASSPGPGNHRPCAAGKTPEQAARVRDRSLRGRWGRVCGKSHGVTPVLAVNGFARSALASLRAGRAH